MDCKAAAYTALACPYTLRPFCHGSITKRNAHLPREADARAQVAEASSLEACGRAGLDHSAVVGANVIDEAREAIGHRDVERRAPVARVLEKPPLRRPRVEDREPAEDLFAVGPCQHASVVGHEQVHRARTMMAAPTAAHTVRSVGPGGSGHGVEIHHEASIGHG